MPPFNENKIILPADVSTEWEKSDWERMENHRFFNASCFLSMCSTECVDLYTRVRVVNQANCRDRIDRSSIEFPDNGQFNTFMFLNHPPRWAFDVIIKNAMGYCFQSVAELDGAKIETTLDMLIVRTKNGFTREQYIELKTNAKQDFVVLNDTWFTSCQKYGFKKITKQFLYDPSVWCEHYDIMDYVNRLIMKRSNQRRAIDFNHIPASQTYRQLDVPAEPPPDGGSNQSAVVVSDDDDMGWAAGGGSASKDYSEYNDGGAAAAAGGPDECEEEECQDVAPAYDVLPWKRRSETSTSRRPPPRQMPSSALPRMTVDRGSLLLGQSFFIYKFTLADIPESDGASNMLLDSLIQLAGYDRICNKIERIIPRLHGTIVESYSGGIPVVVKHLPTWDFTAYKTLLHGDYFDDLNSAVDDSLPLVEDYTFLYVSKGVYKDIRGYTAGSKWFVI